MDEIILQRNEIEWFGVELYPDELNIEGYRGKAEISSLLGDKNEIYFGEPFIKKLEGNYPGIMSTKEELIFVHLPVSFRPARECEFISTSVQLSLLELNEVESKRGVFVDIFPLNIYMPATYKQSVSISPQMKIELSKISQIEVSALKHENSKEYIIYQPSLIAFGKGASTAGWDFEKTLSGSIQGIKDLFVLISKDKGVSLLLDFKVNNCFVQTNIGKIPLSTMFLSGSEKILFKAQHQIV